MWPYVSHAACLVAVSCVGHQHVLFVSVQSELLQMEPSIRQDQGEELGRVKKFMDDSGYSLTEVMDHAGRYYAVLGRRAADSGSSLVALMVADDSVGFLHDPWELREYEQLPSVRWVSLDGGPADVLAVTYDDMVEGPTFTVLFRIESGELKMIFNDENAGCLPARLRDLDDDGVLELISYEEDPSERNCTGLCQLGLRTFYGMTAAWARVRRWTGSEWAVAEDDNGTSIASWHGSTRKSRTGSGRTPPQGNARKLNGRGTAASLTSGCHGQGSWHPEVVENAWSLD
jgi:hypothetical protein